MSDVLILLCVFCYTIADGGEQMENKTVSMCIRVSQEELHRLKQAARLEKYSSYSEFVRRTALIEADNVIKNNETEKEHK
jgi:uncharacterized protein (DUF1778 family)